jgi:hypothetical protein
MSLFISCIKTVYTEELVIYNFLKYGIGKVNRIDFVSHDDDPEYRSAFIYKDPKDSWNPELLEALHTSAKYQLNLTHHIDPPTSWIITENPSPIPFANTTLNIHQLCHDVSYWKGRALDAEKMLAISETSS